MQRHKVSGATTALLLMGAQSAALAAMIALSSLFVDDRRAGPGAEAAAPVDHSREVCVDPLDPKALLPF